mmetsp:Transcript_58496/g.171103  ORF Transcript_58496/g.171103 Transcript_58496/m.171103 type:complete len:475 (-) Transcript_58496:258-1682(-)
MSKRGVPRLLGAAGLSLGIAYLLWNVWAPAGVGLGGQSELKQGKSQATEGWRLGKVPNPFKDPRTCRLTEPGALCDPDDILSADARKQVADVLAAIRSSTSVKCPDGSERSFQVGVALVRHMHPDDWVSGSKEETAKSFAQEIGDRWGVGDAGCDNGVLLLLSLGDRYAYVKTTKTSQQVLTDHLATTVVDNMKPLLRDGNYDEAVLQAVLQIHDVLSGKQIPGASTSWSDLGGALIFCAVAAIYLLPVLTMVLCFLLRCLLMPVAYLLDSASGCCASRGARQAERDLQRVQQELDRDEFDQSMCPICLDSFDASAGGSTVTLDCKHRFHRACIGPWMDEHASCPLCRADVQAPLAPEDEARPQEYQRRLRFYLSRLQRRHPRIFPSSSDSAAYRHDHSGHWIYYHHSLNRRSHQAFASASYANALQSHYERVMQSSRSVLTSMSSSSGSSGGRGGGFGGGGGFSGGGGGGGGW